MCRHDESRVTIICLASAGFMQLNASYEPLIRRCSSPEIESRPSQMRNESARAEINSE